MPNYQFLLFWCQIIRVPNCPTTLGKGVYDWDDDLVQKGGAQPLNPLRVEFVPKKGFTFPLKQISSKRAEDCVNSYPKKHPFILNVEVLARQWVIGISQVLLARQDGAPDDDPHESRVRVWVSGKHQPARDHTTHWQVVIYHLQLSGWFITNNKTDSIKLIHALSRNWLCFSI